MRDFLLWRPFRRPLEECYYVVQLVHTGRGTLKMCHDPVLIIKPVLLLCVRCTWLLDVIFCSLHVHQIHFEEELKTVPRTLAVRRKLNFCLESYQFLEIDLNRYSRYTLQSPLSIGHKRSTSERCYLSHISAISSAHADWSFDSATSAKCLNEIACAAT